MSIHNEVGEVRILAMVTEDIMTSVVCLQERTWPMFDYEGVEMSGSPNVLALTEPTMSSRATRTHTNFVEVEKS